MPSRFVILTIVAFWLATSSWLFYKDLLPRLETGEPPPFTIDLADEAQIDRYDSHSGLWTVSKNGKREGKAETGVKYLPKEDLFKITGVIKLGFGEHMKGDAQQIITTHFLVTRDGELKAIEGEIQLTILEMPYKGEIKGPVENRVFRPHINLWSPLLEISRDLDPVTLSARGSVINPLQPMNRVLGLRKGQHWQIPMIDPLADALSLIIQRKSSEPRFLIARVQTETANLDWQRKQVPCLVVEYTGDDMTARTFVREADGLVLRQEVTLNGENLVLERD
jgi:hypothetical protein